MSSLSGSGVFSSRVDYFCLVCESRLTDDADAIAHVAKPVHTKNFLATEYFGNERDCVRKIKKWYLCEFCNVLLPTASGVRLHVAEARHAEYRAEWALRRREGRVLAFASVQLEDSAWNGIVDDTCAICNTEFDDEHIHRNETGHILKLIQSKVELDENQNLYRRVDKNTVHCITCNKLVAFNSIDVHFDDDEHKLLYQRCCEQNKFNSDENKVEVETGDVAPSASIEISDNIKMDVINDQEHLEIEKNDKKDVRELNSEKIKKISETLKMDDTKCENNSENEDILSSIENFTNNDIKINIETQTATCNKCEKNLDFHVKLIKDHILEHKIEDANDENVTNEVTSDVEPTEELNNGKTSDGTIKNKQKQKKVKTKREHSSTLDAIKFAKENDMTYLDTDDKVYCNKCKVNIPTSLKCLQEHVAGSAHLKATNKQHLEVVLFKNGDESHEEPSDKIITKDFVLNAVFIDSISKCVVINDSICISILSYELMVEENNKLKCLMCERKVFMHEFDTHRKQYYHNKTSSECFVLRELSNEFIREIKRQHFHCGYCNSVHTPWSAMLTHTQSTDHWESKSSAQVRLRNLMPLIIQHRRENEIKKFMHVFGFMFGANRRRNYYSDSDSD